MTRPLLYDLFCGAGGAAMGYARAGFEVVGIDVAPQPRYPFRFVRGDALRPPVDLRNAAAVHASPPCQAYSRATAWRGDRGSHPDLIAVTRALLLAAGVPYVIENVQEARGLLRNPVVLCGTMFGLPLRRHRFFECPALPLLLLPDCQHRGTDFSHDHGKKQTEAAYREAMGCGWMTAHEAREAVPPAYTEFLGRSLLALV